jgi:hypothetical protein
MFKQLAAIPVLFLPLFTQAGVIDFESLYSEGTGFVDAGANYAEDGFSMVIDLGPYTSSFKSPETGNTRYYVGPTTTMYANIMGRDITLSKLDGTTFDLHSIDLSEIDRERQHLDSWVLFSGHKQDGSVVTDVFEMDKIFGMETFTFTGFTDLTSVVWQQGRPGIHQFDNIVYSLENGTIPVPASILLFGVGFAGLALTRKK